MTQLDQKKSEHLTPADCLDDAFILTKISKLGRRYFYMDHDREALPDGRSFIVAKTGYLPGDGFVFQDELSAMEVAVHLNNCGIGGACWLAILRSDAIANSGTC